MICWKFQCSAYDVYPDHETLANMIDEEEYNAKMRKEYDTTGVVEACEAAAKENK